MKCEGTISLCTVILSAAFLSNAIQSNAQSGTAIAEANVSVEHSTSMRMVSAPTVFSKTLDAKDAKPGQEFEVSLTQKVKLNDGQELPKGTVLVGTIVTNETQSGKSKLTFRFVQARAKDGKTIPIQAVATGLYDQGSLNAQYGNNGWTPGQVNVQQDKAAGGLTLHSQVGSSESATLESKKDNVKIDRGSALFLALAPGEASSAVNGGK
jgi:hypothetical protein